jgi:hypothetical protein
MVRLGRCIVTTHVQDKGQKARWHIPKLKDGLVVATTVIMTVVMDLRFNSQGDMPHKR